MPGDQKNCFGNDGHTCAVGLTKACRATFRLAHWNNLLFCVYKYILLISSVNWNRHKHHELRLCLQIVSGRRRFHSRSSPFAPLIEMCYVKQPLPIPRGGPGSGHLLCGFRRSSRSTTVQACCPLPEYPGLGVGAAPPMHSRGAPHMEAHLAQRGAKEVINLLCFRVQHQRGRLIACTMHTRYLKGGLRKMNKEKKLQKMLSLTTITTKVHCLEIQVKQYFCFRKWMKLLIPCPAIAQPGILYESPNLYQNYLSMFPCSSLKYIKTAI